MMLRRPPGILSAKNVSHPSLSGRFGPRRSKGTVNQQTIVHVTSQAAAAQHFSGAPTAAVSAGQPLSAAAAAPAPPPAPPLPAAAGVTTTAAQTLEQLMQQQPDNIHDGIYTCSIPKQCNTSKTAAFIAGTLQSSSSGSVLRLRAAGPVAVLKALKCIAKASAIVQQQSEGAFLIAFEPQRQLLPTDQAGRWTVDLDKARFNVMDLYVHRAEASAATNTDSSSSERAGATGAGPKPFRISNNTDAAAVKDRILKAVQKQQQSLVCAAIGANNLKTMLNGIAWARQQYDAQQHELRCTVSFSQQQLELKAAAASAAAAAGSSNVEQQDNEQQQQQDSHAGGADSSSSRSSSSAGGDASSQHQPRFAPAFQVTVRCCPKNISSSQPVVAHDSQNQ